MEDSPKAAEQMLKDWAENHQIQRIYTRPEDKGREITGALLSERMNE